jgi:4-amino-4-deoxy-L-arabinose transferase-like glycosyltransferase
MTLAAGHERISTRERAALPRIREVSRWPLLVVLAVQACLSARMILATSGPSNDEALYLGYGRLLLEHWQHGSSVPLVAGYFSGSPIIYPPLGALANSAGGLYGARTLSLLFMLGATVVLWATASRVISRGAALGSTALFAVLAPVVHIGSLATYDAMAAFLVALAAFFALHRGAGWLAAAVVTLAAANMAKYSSALFDPAVVCVAALGFREMGSFRDCLRRGGAVAGGTMGTLTVLLLLGGTPYWHGVRATTLTRHASTDPSPDVLLHGLSWSWIILVLAAAGVVISALRDHSAVRIALLATLAATGLLAPLEQARIHTLLSLDKHVAFGAWFAAIPAGLALSVILRGLRARAVARPTRLPVYVMICACVAVPVPVVALSEVQARQMAGYSRTDNLVRLLRPMTAGHGRFLSDTARVDAYELPDVPWTDWVKVQNSEPEARTQQLAHKIVHRRFSLIALVSSHDGTPQAQLEGVLEQTGIYRLVAVARSSSPGHRRFFIWQLRKIVPHVAHR